MTTPTFHATCLALAHPEGLSHLLGFADSQYHPQRYLLLQRAFEHDEQDTALGMDRYHVEWCGQGQSRYGGIARFVLRPGLAEVDFAPEAVASMGVAQLRIGFDVAPEQWAALCGVLESIFQGSDCEVVVAGGVA